MIITRVDRFFLTQYTKTVKNIRNCPLNYQMTIKYTKMTIIGIFQMAIEYTNHFHSEAIQNLPKLV
jgi:hypothetical protein